MKNEGLGNTSINVLLERMLDESENILEAMRKEREESRRAESTVINKRKEILKRLSGKK